MTVLSSIKIFDANIDNIANFVLIEKNRLIVVVNIVGYFTVFCDDYDHRKKVKTNILRRVGLFCHLYTINYCFQ